MAKVGKHDPDAELTWIDHDNFVDDAGQWWRVVETHANGRLLAVCYFVDDGGSIRQGRYLTTRYAALNRPDAGAEREGEREMSDHPLDYLTNWMEDLEGKSLDELRRIRLALGHDVEASERQFLDTLIDRLKDSLDGEWEEV